MWPRPADFPAEPATGANLVDPSAGVVAKVVQGEHALGGMSVPGATVVPQPSSLRAPLPRYHRNAERYGARTATRARSAEGDANERESRVVANDARP